MPEVNHSAGNKAFLVSVTWAQLGVRITWNYNLAWFVYFVQLLFCPSRRHCHLPPPHCHPHWKSRDKYSLSCHTQWDNKSLCPKFLLNFSNSLLETSLKLSPLNLRFGDTDEILADGDMATRKLQNTILSGQIPPSSVPRTCSNWVKTEGPQLMAEGDTSDVVLTTSHPPCSGSCKSEGKVLC